MKDALIAIFGSPEEENRLRITGDRLLWTSKKGETEIWQGQAEEISVCLDASLSPCFLLVAQGRLCLLRESAGRWNPRFLTPEPQAGVSVTKPLLCESGGLLALCLLQEPASCSILAYHETNSGVFRGRRLWTGAAAPDLLCLLQDPPGCRLFLHRSRGNEGYVTSMDVTASTPQERTEFTAPEPLTETQFLSDPQGKWHFAYLSGGALYADGTPLAGQSCSDICLFMQVTTPTCLFRRQGQLLGFRLTPEGWRPFSPLSYPQGSVCLELDLQRPHRTYLAENQAPREEFPPEEPPRAMDEETRLLLHNHALLLRSLQEKAEQQQRLSFTLQAKIDALSQQAIALRRRCEALETALQTVEHAYRK